MATKIGTFFEEKEVKTYEVEEGTMTYHEGVDPNNGLPNEQVTFASQVNQESFLIRGTGERSMKLAVNGEVATHFNPYAPEVEGSLPKETTVQGSYPKRFVGAYKLKSEEIQLPLADDNAEIAVGDKLNINPANGKLDKTSASTNVVYAYDAIAANRGGYITVDCNGGIGVVTRE
jgi:hypothetical protein